MLAVGLGLPEDTFLDAGRYGWVSTLLWLWRPSSPLIWTRSHLLAPTATNLDKYGHLDT